jgi:hypothetical protein
VGRFKGIAAGVSQTEKRPPKREQAKADNPKDETAPAQEVKRRGRPKGSGKGKRSSKDFKLAGAYLKRKTHSDVMRSLFDDPRDFSDLVEELLEGWLKDRN